MGDSTPLSHRFVVLASLGWEGRHAPPVAQTLALPEPSPRPLLGHHQLLGCGVGRGGRCSPRPGDPVSPYFVYKTQLKDRIIKNVKMVTAEH